MKMLLFKFLTGVGSFNACATSVTSSLLFVMNNIFFFVVVSVYVLNLIGIFCIFLFFLNKLNEF